MDINKLNDHLYPIRSFVHHIPQNRRTVLLFLPRTMFPPSINGLQTKKAICSSNETILHLFDVNDLVRLSYSKILNVSSGYYRGEFGKFHFQLGKNWNL